MNKKRRESKKTLKKKMRKKRRIKTHHHPDQLRNYEAGHTYGGLKTSQSNMYIQS